MTIKAAKKLLKATIPAEFAGIEPFFEQLDNELRIGIRNENGLSFMASIDLR